MTSSINTVPINENQSQPQPQPSQSQLDENSNLRDVTESDKRPASWPSVLFYIHLNILGLYGILVLFTNTSLTTTLFTIFLCLFSVIGVTAGSHRLWAHRTYKANIQLRFLLMILQTLAGQGSIYNWVRNHRLHHQTFKTDDDIFYSNKDFLSAQVFAQIRSLSIKQEKLLKEIDMSDLEQDKIVMFQHKFYWILYIIICILLPVNAPLEYWGDSIPSALFVALCLRYLIVLNICWLISSAHFIWGLDKAHKPSDSNMIFLVTKTYWPYYHYMLPSDYQTGEFGDYGDDCTTVFIRIFSAIGWAIDLQIITCDAVRKGLTEAATNDRPVVECIKEAAQEDIKNIPKNRCINLDKYL